MMTILNDPNALKAMALQFKAELLFKPFMTDGNLELRVEDGADYVDVLYFAERSMFYLANYLYPEVPTIWEIYRESFEMYKDPIEIDRDIDYGPIIFDTLELLKRLMPRALLNFMDDGEQ